MHFTDGDFSLEPADHPSNGVPNSTTPFSATVLLAIPETGESDYFAESPQCLTVEELRNLGLYDDEEEEDGDDDEETDGEMKRVECLVGGLPEGSSRFELGEQRQEKADRYSPLVDSCRDLDGEQLFSAIRVKAGRSEKSPDPSGHVYPCIPTVGGELVR